MIAGACDNDRQHTPTQPPTLPSQAWTSMSFRIHLSNNWPEDRYTDSTSPYTARAARKAARSYFPTWSIFSIIYCSIFSFP